MTGDGRRAAAKRTTSRRRQAIMLAGLLTGMASAALLTHAPLPVGSSDTERMRSTPAVPGQEGAEQSARAQPVSRQAGREDSRAS